MDPPLERTLGRMATGFAVPARFIRHGLKSALPGSAAILAAGFGVPPNPLPRAGSHGAAGPPRPTPVGRADRLGPPTSP